MTMVYIKTLTPISCSKGYTNDKPREMAEATGICHNGEVGIGRREKNTNQEITLKNPNPYELLEATGKWRWGVDGAKKSPYTLNYTGSMIFCRVTVMHEGSTFG